MSSRVPSRKRLRKHGHTARWKPSRCSVNSETVKIERVSSLFILARNITHMRERVCPASSNFRDTQQTITTDTTRCVIRSKLKKKTCYDGCQYRIYRIVDS